MYQRPSSEHHLDQTPSNGNPYLREFRSTDSAEIRFGDWMIRRGLITRFQLFVALTTSFSKGCRIGDAVVENNYLGREQVETEAEAHLAFHAFQSGDAE